jgi:predicted helicase
MLKIYVKGLFKVASRGDAREESYYSTLEKLLYDYSDIKSFNNISVTTLPKKTEAGNPDFRIWDGKQHITGYIEAKTPHTNLDDVQYSEQLKRYRGTFPNLILTNFFEFRLFRNGELIDRVQIARPFMIDRLKMIPTIEHEDNFLSLLERFFSFSLPKVYNAKNLAVELAKRTRFLKDEVITQEIKEEQEGKSGQILSFYNAFHKYLIFGLTHEEFADFYSQTITYGLFAARTRNAAEFNRKLAYDKIPHTIGILRDVFHFISLGDLPQTMEWIIDDIAEILSVTDVKAILHEYFHEGKGKDPIVHFYETFLTEYDPETREKRGIYYTPEPIVSFIVRSLNKVLKDKFSKSSGFSSEKVTVLDPAGGTLTFLTEAAKLTVQEYVNKYGDGAKKEFIKSHILENFFAFELMMAPYAIGHLKMAFFLEELGYKLADDDRFKYYLTNTLEMEKLEQIDIPGLKSLSEESEEAGKIKKDKPILVIMGNPPYSGHSANKGKWMDDLLKKGYSKPDEEKDDGYYMVDGKPLGERNPKWLQDDYVKFIRFAQWKIDQAGEGVLGFITNHSYIDNPTFRGMRQSLMKTFDEIYILDLHGNSLKKETCPDGSKDGNVFDIMQGVAIAFFIKSSPARKVDRSDVFHSDLYGIRDLKYDWLAKNDITTTNWQKLKPKSEFYFFAPYNKKLENQYYNYSKITDIFPVNSVGFLTHKDKFLINFDLSKLKRNVQMFLNNSIPWEIIKSTFSLKEYNFKKRKLLQDVSDIDQYFVKCHYRVFDERFIFYCNKIVDRPRTEVLHNMLENNYSIICQRQTYGLDFNHAFIADKISDLNYISNLGGGSVFPLYLYPDKEKLDIFSRIESEEKKPNINKKIWESVKKAISEELTTEDFLFYIYAVLFSKVYRTKFAEFLKKDFPRIPLTKDPELFFKLSEYGKQLADLHLLKSSELETPSSKFFGEGDNRVKRVKFEKNKVYINENKYFDGVPEEVWNYYIGGYQVCYKWLKDRKDRILSVSEVKTYCKIVTALEKTIEIQNKIDEIYNDEDNILFDEN